MNVNLAAAVQFIRNHSTMVVAVGTAGLCLYCDVATARSNVERYAATQQVLTQSVDSTSNDLRESLKAADAKFRVFVAKRELLTRDMQKQVCEQQKSIARLQSALRFCVHHRVSLVTSPSPVADDSNSSSSANSASAGSSM